VHTNSSLNLQFSSARRTATKRDVLCNENTLVPNHPVLRTKARNCVRDFIFIYFLRENYCKLFLRNFFIKDAYKVEYFLCTWRIFFTFVRFFFRGIYPFAQFFSLDFGCRMYNVVLNKIIHKCYSHNTRITFRSRLTRFSQFLVCIQRVNNPVPPTSICSAFSPHFPIISKDSDHECIYILPLCLSMSFYINISDLH